MNGFEDCLVKSGSYNISENNFLIQLNSFLNYQM